MGVSSSRPVKRFFECVATTGFPDSSVTLAFVLITVEILAAVKYNPSLDSGIRARDSWERPGFGNFSMDEGLRIGAVLRWC